MNNHQPHQQNQQNQSQQQFHQAYQSPPHPHYYYQPKQITPEIKAKHDKSVKKYPQIKFSPSEYMIIDVKRSVWGAVRIWVVSITASVAFMAFAILMAGTFAFIMIGIAMVIFAIIAAKIGVSVYYNNYLYVTNERAIMRIQITPFNYRYKNIELENIEDCSYEKDGPIHTILNFGKIRLSTIGDQHTYTFYWVDNPRKQFKVVNAAVQAVDRSRKLRK